jgi:hypothetical protein
MVASRRSCIVLSLSSGIWGSGDLEGCVFCCQTLEIKQGRVVRCRLIAIGNRYASDKYLFLFHQPNSTNGA